MCTENETEEIAIDQTPQVFMQSIAFNDNTVLPLICNSIVVESDDYFLRAKRIEIPASITACPFYKKMGYTYKNGIDIIDEEQLFRLEKFR